MSVPASSSRPSLTSGAARLRWVHRRVQRRVAGPTGLGLDHGPADYLVVANSGTQAADTLTFTTVAVSGRAFRLRGTPQPLDVPAGAQATWALYTPGGPNVDPAVIEVQARSFEGDAERHGQWHVAIGGH